MKKPRKPKLKKLPKRPKQSSNEQVWKRWNERAKKVQAENNKKVAEYNKELNAYFSKVASKERLRKDVAKHTVKFKS